MSLDRIGSCFKCSLDGLYKKDHSDGEREVRQRERGWRKEGRKERGSRRVERRA